MVDVEAVKRLRDLLLLVRDDCFFEGGYYVLRPYTVEKLLEQALDEAGGLLRQYELAREPDELGLYEMPIGLM